MISTAEEQNEVFTRSPASRSNIRGKSARELTATVLVTAAGGIVGQGIIKSLRLANGLSHSPIRYHILATDNSPLAAGLYRSDIGLVVPKASDPAYLDSIIRHLNNHSVDALFVGSDEELMTVAAAKRRIEKETASKVLVNELDVIKIARDKWETYRFLKSHNLSCAESCLPENRDMFIKEFGFPIVVKPREGFGSVNFFVTNSIDEIDYALSKIQDYGWSPMLQEYLPGRDEEFTSGITIDKNGTSIMSSIAIRKYLKGGQTYKAFIDDYEPVRLSAENIAARLGVTGAVNIQSKYVLDNEPTRPISNAAITEPEQISDYLDNGMTKVFEINPRFSATCPLRSYAGINEPDLVFRNTVFDEKIEKIGRYTRLVCMRYWNEVYVDYSTYEKLKTVGSVDHGIENSCIPDYF
jgi:carbamoyl-phosphate synthase large subunit